MTRRTIALASLVAALLPATARAAYHYVTVLPGCTVTAWTPDFRYYSGPPGGPGISWTGDTGARTDCP